MASYDAAINLIVNGGSKIDQIINKAAQLEGIVNSLNKTPLDLSVKKATSEFDKFDTNLKALKAEIGNQQKALDTAANSIDKYTDKIASTQRQLSALNPNTKKYNEVLERQQRAIEGLAGAQKALASAEQNLATQEGKLAGTQKAAGRAKATKLATEALSNLADEYLRLGAAQEKGATGQILKNQSQSTIARLAAQADALKLVADNSEIASSQFNRFVIASQLASQKIYEGRQKQLGALAFGLSKEAPGVNIGTGGKSSIAAARDTIDSLIGSYGGVVKSEAALSSYISRLQSLQSLVPYLSEEYSKLELAIAEVSMEMDSLQKQTKFLGAVSKIQPQAGPASLLPSESVKSAADKAKYYSKIDDQVSRLVGFEERITQANLTQTQKLELRARLDKALSLLSENRLDDAKRETIEIERQRMSLERMNRASKPASEVKPLGPSTALGTGAELRERNKYEAEGIRLRDKIAKATNDVAEATNDAAAAVQRLEAAQDRISFIQQFEEIQAGIKDAGDEVDKFLQKEKKATADFDKRLRETTKTIKQVKQGAAVDLGGGAELKARARFDQSREQSARKLNNIIASGAIIEQGLINLQGKGVDVTETLIRLQQSLNSAKKDDFEVTQQTVDALGDQVSLAGKFAQLQNKILAGQAKGGKAQAGGSGLEAALKSLQEARGARQAFLGGASPAEAIDKIVREFGTKKDIGAGIGENITNTFASDLLSGGKQMASAAISAFTSVVAAIKKVFGIASPSRVMREIAENLISSFIVELVSNIPSVKAALEKTFDVQRSIYEQSGRRLSGRSAFPVELDPGFLAAVSGSPLTPGRPSPAGAFSAATPRVGAPGSAFPFQTYNLATTQFPTDAAAQLNAPRNRGTDANRVLSEAIREYRAAVDNFWEGEDSQFEAIKKIVVSSTRLASAQLARRLQQTKDLTPDQQFQQIAREARSAIAAGGQSRFSRGITAVGNIINGDRDLGVSRFLVNAEDQAKAVFQRMSDSILNSIEAFGFSVGNLFGDGLDRIRGLVPGAVSRALSSISEAVTDFGGIGGFGGFGGGGAGGAVPPNAGGSVNQTAQLLGFDAIADISRVSTRELEALSAAASELRAVLDPTIEGFDRLDNQLRETIGNIDRQLQRRDPNADFLTRRVGPRTGRAISEGLIGGAFPLLFGQGVGASIGGLAGGAAGGFAGGGLGFGLSLIGTALGTAFDTAVQSAKELGDALQKPVENFDKLTEKSFFSSRALEEQIKKTIEYGDTATASAAIQEEAFKKLGVDGVNNLKNLGTESDRLNRAFAELGQQMQAVAAGPLSAVTGFFADIFGQAAAAGRVRLLRSNLNPGQEQQFNQEIIQRLNQRGIQRGFFAGSTPSESEIGILQQQGALQDIVDKWQALTIKGKIKITEKDKLESELNALEKQLSVLDIGKGLISQVRQATQEQEDLDRQRADLVRSYEESFGEIRKKVEDEVARKRFAVIEQENRLLDIRAANELSALQASNREFVSQAGLPTGRRPEFVEAAQEAASIVAQFTEQQLSAEQEAAKIKRNAALDAKKFDFESVQFKASIEKEITRLNIETARKVADINLQVARKNEEYDDRRFKLEKALLTIRLKSAQLDAESNLKSTSFQLSSAQDPANKAYFGRLREVYLGQLELINSITTDIENTAPPAKVRGIKGVGTRNNVSTGALDQLVANEADVIKQQTNALLEGIQIDTEASINNFNREIQKLVASYSTPLTQKITDILDEREQEYDYIVRIGRGVSGLVGEKEKEIVAEGKLLKLRLEGLKASLEEGKYRTDEKGNRVLQAPAVVAQLEAQIQNIDNELLRLPGLIDRQIADATALIAPIPGLRVAQRLDEVQTSLQELATWESIGITAAESVGDAFGQAFKEISAGTASAQEVLAGFFQNLANAFSDMASQMIAQMVQMLLFKQLLGPFLNTSIGNLFAPGSSGFTFPGFFGAADGAAFSNGIKPFAMGGIVSSPTLFKFADGGAMNTGVMGEAGPEAIMPLSRGSDGKLGVSASGSGGNTNVTVNVDATGSKVQGDNSGANQLGRAVAAAVQEELLRQKRPGGLLS